MTVRQSTNILGPLVKTFSETSISARCSRLSGAAERRSKAVRSSIISSTEFLPLWCGLTGGVYPIANDREKLLWEGAEGDDRVEAAEGERIGEGRFDSQGARFIGDVIEVTFGVGLVVIRGGRQNAVMQREHSGDGFERASGAEGVAVHRFGRTDADFISVRAEDFADGAAFHRIIAGSASAVGVDVAYRFESDPAFLERSAHGPRGTLHGGLGEVMRVGRHAKAANLGADLCATRLGYIHGLQDHHRTAFTQNQAAAVLAEGPAGIGCDDAHGFPGFQHADGEHRFTDRKST